MNLKRSCLEEMIKIMLDAGHDKHRNKSPCDTTPVYYESDFAWKFHLMLKDELEKYGFIVDTTRASQDEVLSVDKRGQKAKGYDMFISIHSNAASGIKEGTDRPVVIFPVLANDKVALFAEEMAVVIHNTMQTKQNGTCYSKSYSSSKPNVDYYGVIRGAVEKGCDNAFIFEHSFHTDTRATKWLLIDSNLKKMAVNEANNIAEFLGVTRKYYIVYEQVGAFKNLKNAENLLKEKQTQNINAFIREEER